MKNLIAAAVATAAISTPIFAQDAATSFAGGVDFYAYAQLGTPFDPQPEYTFEPVSDNNVTEVPLAGVSGIIGIGGMFSQTGPVTVGFEADMAAGNIESERVVEDTTPCIIDGDDDG